ncbi:MAG TPA: hypothetical protein VL126_12205 [Bacteroidota bacterium]|nr:hypothetical protein [Bacteroidota bacterium]
MRTFTIILAGCVAVVGLLIATGLMVNGAIAAQQRIVLGAVVFLYGTYRLTVAYYRRPTRRDP